MKIIVLGHARHGKDTTCEILKELYGLTFVSSSYFVAEKAVRPWLAARGIHYPSIEKCYEDRVNYRRQWYDAICEYNMQDAARLGRELFSKFDIYCGLRNLREFQALQKEKAFDVAFWVDRSKLVEPEGKSSNTIMQIHADFVIDNNGTLEDLKGNVKAMYTLCQIAYK